jgi:tetratricopeptide (TPR) repeat protein
MAVLRAAVTANRLDAKARYLLGTLYFSRGLADQALAEWRVAKQSQPDIPMLDASLGVALLYAKNDPEAALQSFREGLRNDRENDALYLGADQSLSLLGKPSAERVAVFESYPDVTKMPAPLIFELVSNLTESKDFDRALALFHNRFFPREEGGTDVRQVWVEVELQLALNQAQSGQCNQALSTASSLLSPVKDASFTTDGLTPFVDSARTNYLLGKIQVGCGEPERGRKHFERARARSRPHEIVWAWLAANQLPGFDPSDWARRLKSALEQSESMSETGALAGWWAYNTGMLDRELGREQDARVEFHKALLLPDLLLSYHLTREALAEP